MIRLFVTILVVSCLCFAGCGGCQKRTGQKLAEKMAEMQMARNGVKGEVNISDDKVSIKTKDGATTMAYGKSVKVPAGFPADVKVYDGATIVTAMTVPNGFNLQLMTKDSLEKVAEFYKARMAADGWTEEGIYASSQQSTLSYKKGKRTTNIMAMESDKATSITLMTATEATSDSN
jgi:hypothetical protein